MNERDEQFDVWAVIDLMGHRRIAGHVTVAPVGGGNLLRVDIPDGNGGVAATRLIGTSSIYEMHITTEEVVRRMAGTYYEINRPMIPYLPAPAAEPQAVGINRYWGEDGDDEDEKR